MDGPSPGLCETCIHLQVIRSDRGSVFYRCRLSETDPRFPKYPRIPVIQCDGWLSHDGPLLLDDAAVE